MNFNFLGLKKLIATVYTGSPVAGKEFSLLSTFSESQKRAAYEKQKGICKKCGKHFEFNEMEGDHITPWSKGGKTSPENCQMLCLECNRRKSDI